jgi:hypothetical protein
MRSAAKSMATFILAIMNGQLPVKNTVNRTRVTVAAAETP